MALINKGEGICHADVILSTPHPRTGQPWSEETALDEVIRMIDEAQELCGREMYNVPEAVVRVLRLVTMAIDCLAINSRAAQLRDRPKTDQPKD